LELILGVGIVIAFIVGYFLRKSIAEAKIISAEEAAKKIIAEAEKGAEAKKREAILEAKEEVLKLRNEVEKENRERRSELQRLERRLMQKEETLDRKTESIEKKEEALTRKEADIENIKAKLNELYENQRAELERLSGLTSEEARQLLLSSVEEEIKHDTAMLIKEIEKKPIREQKT